MTNSLEKQLSGLTSIEHLGRLLNNVLVHQITVKDITNKDAIPKEKIEKSRVSVDTSFNQFIEIIRKEFKGNKITFIDEELKMTNLISQFRKKWEDLKRWEIEHHNPSEGDPLFNELVEMLKEIYYYFTYNSELVMNIDSGTHRLIDVVIYNLIDTSIMLPKLIAMGEIHLNSGVTATQRVNLMVLKNLLQKNLEAIVQSFHDSIKENNVLNELFQASEAQAFLGEYTNAANYFLKLIETKLLKHTSPTITINEYTNAGVTVFNDVVDLENHTISILKKLINFQISTLNYRKKVSIISVLVGSFLVFLFYLSKVMRKPLDDFALGIEQFAAGDLTVRINITSNDEVAEMTQEFNTLAEKFEAMIRKFKNIAKQLSIYSDKIYKNTKELESNINNQEHAILNIASHAKGISKTVHEFRTKLSDVNFSVSQTSQLAERGLTSLNEMKQVISNMDRGTSNIVNSLSDLQKNVGIINTVINEIIKIVDQANLLSLNSAITANRSGAKGAGFTVVSEKIKELADQTAFFTLDIEEKVRDIAPEVTLGVDSVVKFTGGIKQQAKATQQTDDELQKLITYTQSQTSMFDIVNTSMLNQLNGSTAIDNSISELSSVAQVATKSISCLLREIDYLCETTTTIESVLSDFKVAEEEQEVLVTSDKDVVDKNHAKNIELLKSLVKISKKEQISSIANQKAKK